MTRRNAATLDSELISLADALRGLSALVTKIGRADLQNRLDRLDAGISAIEHGVLRRIDGGIETIAEISRLMTVTPSTLVYVIDGLVKKGLLKRKPDPKDRRRELLLLTPSAKKLILRIPNMDAESVLVESLRQMDISDCRSLVKQMRVFVAGLHKTPESAPSARTKPVPGGQKIP